MRTKRWWPEKLVIPLTREEARAYHDTGMDIELSYDGWVKELVDIFDLGHASQHVPPEKYYVDWKRNLVIYAGIAVDDLAAGLDEKIHEGVNVSPKQRAALEKVYGKLRQAQPEFYRIGMEGLGDTKLKYDEFFVTPSGTVDIRWFPKGKTRAFEQTTIGRDGIVPDDVVARLKPADIESLALWNEIQFLLREFPYPAHAYVFAVARSRVKPFVEIQFQIATEESGLVPSQVRCWKNLGRKRWGWENAENEIEVSSCIQSAFESVGWNVGGGYQVTYFPITLGVSDVEQAQQALQAARKVFEETGIGPFILPPKPWSDAG